MQLTKPTCRSWMMLSSSFQHIQRLVAVANCFRMQASAAQARCRQQHRTARSVQRVTAVGLMKRGAAMLPAQFHLYQLLLDMRQ